jgi:hypothetical protein
LIFAKGRLMTSLYGSLSNQEVNSASGASLKTIGYTIGTKSGSFIKNNWVFGLNFALSRTDFSNADIDIDYEDLLLGLWTRLYFAQKGAAAFILTGNVGHDEAGQGLFDDFKSSFGFGPRFFIYKDKRTLLRLDFGFNNEGGSGIYFGINEAF